MAKVLDFLCALEASGEQFQGPRGNRGRFLAWARAIMECYSNAARVPEKTAAMRKEMDATESMPLGQPASSSHSGQLQIL
eukprot:3118312-Amphidinium_carterae.1